MSSRANKQARRGEGPNALQRAVTYPGRFVNTVGATITGGNRGTPTDETKYLSDKELAFWQQGPRSKKAKK